MAGLPESLSPDTSALLWRLIALLLVGVLWFESGGGAAGIMLLLALAAMALWRRRAAAPGWTVWLDQAACLAAVPVWPEAGFGLALPSFEAMKGNRPLYVLPALIAAIAVPVGSVALLLYLALSACVGWVIRLWDLQVERYRREADRERKHRYALERFRDELLRGQIDAALTAELFERNRIARELHDHVGHELTGSALAFEAYEQLRKEGDPLADDMFAKANTRLADSIRHLRDAVHNMTPIRPLGVESIERICGFFTACPLELQVDGDVTRVPVYVWSVLEPCLKEALTNISRHSRATRVDVSLDVSEYIVRLSVRNDGVDRRRSNRTSRGEEHRGLGLRNVRQRARAAGGNVSSSFLDAGFIVICVLPLKKGEA